MNREHAVNKQPSFDRVGLRFLTLFGVTSPINIRQLLRSLEERLVRSLTAQPAAVPLLGSKETLWVTQALWGEGPNSSDFSHTGASGD